MTVGPWWQTAVFALSALGAIVVSATLDPGLAVQMALLAPFVAVLGLPHGALDWPIAEALWPLDSRRAKLLFVALYLGLVGCVVLVWVIFPGPALIAFLTYSAIHFSEDWSNAPAGLRWSGGTATIGAPALFHQQDVTRLFDYLAPENVAIFAAQATALTGGLALALLLVTLLCDRNARGQAALEQVLLWSTAFVLEPLIYFAVYFCALHSMRHFTIALKSTANARRGLGMSIALSIVVIGVAAVFVGSQGQIGTAASEIPDVLMQTIFIGLAALTVPHMLLVDRFHRMQGNRMIPEGA